MDYDRARAELTSGQFKYEERENPGHHSVTKKAVWHRRLAWKTYLDGAVEEDIILTYRDLELVTYFPSGHFAVTPKGWRTITTMQKITEYTPFRAYSYNGYGFLSTPTKTRALREQMHITSDGTLMDDSHLNDVDAEEFYDKLGPYVNQYVHRLVYGKMNEPKRYPRTLEEEPLDPGSSPIAAELVMNGEYSPWLIKHVLTRNGATLAFVLPGCWKKNYWQWLKPKSRRQEVQLYALELEGKRIVEAARPKLHRKLLKKHLTDYLLEAVSLEKIERPRQ